MQQKDHLLVTLAGGDVELSDATVRLLQIFFPKMIHFSGLWKI